MDRDAKFVNILKSLGGNNNIPCIIGTVKTVGDDSCVVTYGADDNTADLTDVRLKASIDTDVSNYTIVYPAVGSKVICASISGDYEDLCVVKCDSVDHIVMVQNGLNILIDGSDGKVRISNSETSLYDLFGQLVQILGQLKVYTPSGVSGTPIPDSMERINEFENNFKQLLK